MRPFPPAAAIAAALLLFTPLPAQADPVTRKVEIFDERGPAGHAEVVDSPNLRARVAAAAATVTPVEINGPSSNRIDLVYLGDGYTSGELGAYADQVASSWAKLTSYEPFTSRRKMFNVWRVDITSPVSGVSGDPTSDVVKDTPLGTYFWCGDIERLLCLDVDAAKGYAALAPEADQIAVVANTTKYGGAGYTDDELVTFSGGNQLGTEILPHELGHSIGDLADEYGGDPTGYTGTEPAAVNVSVKTAVQMQAQQKKWYRWLGAATPDGGVIDTYEGAHYHDYGIYRPSQDSMMRSLKRPFNAVSREKMIQSFYATARPLDSYTSNASRVSRGSTLTITTLPISPLSITWYVNGTQNTAWNGLTSVTVPTNLPAAARISVTVSDPTADVRDPDYQSAYLSQTITWRVR
ncbi:M64 family metallopeptidase [Nonomuraea africana]|uniref:Peptidase M64 n=1 Tax=Nonomuraea africana TaxID=46171 RepID=A0ABR9KK42_9ACTN|nr:M64 family metallopeptidase [Nonomuraea africana]MBE1562003.1 hypothetical protein [Nonomuraea africana]